jgi:hypothetical protein
MNGLEHILAQLSYPVIASGRFCGEAIFGSVFTATRREIASSAWR